MKKIGLITFHSSHNNGSMLQAIALQHVLENKYKLDIEMIDFSNIAQRDMYSALPKATNWKKLVKKMICITNYGQLIKQYKTYEVFKKKYFNLSSQSYKYTYELEAIKDNYDAFITGSDQVWNIKCIDADDAYYLSFCQTRKKYAYAVSFGANNPFTLEKKSGHYEKLITEFSKISVREFNAQKWIEDATGLLAPVCLDPTMLFDLEEWEQLVDIGDKPIISGNYIFYYCFSIDTKVQKFLRKVSQKYNMPVYSMDAKEWTLKCCWKNKINLIKEYGPAAYMNVVKYANIFITTSFHGTAFATIYEKCFWYINDGNNDISRDDRALTFLTQLGLMSRYKTIDELNVIDLRQKQNYKEAKERVRNLRKESLEYIDELVKDIDND